MHNLGRLTGLTSVRFDCRMEHLTPLNLGTTLISLTSLARISISNIHLGRKYGTTSTAGWTQVWCYKTMSIGICVMHARVN